MDFVKGLEQDIKHTLSVKEARENAINNTPANPLPKTYGVNELAKSLHPIATLAKVKEIKDCTSSSKILVLESLSHKFPYFRAGTFITLSAKTNNNIITRPYSIFSSPKMAMKGILELGIQSAGLFSNYLTNDLKVGDLVVVGEPSGDFYYDNIRDKKNIIAIAGGSGITPFISMAKSIKEGSEDFNLTILYGVKTLKDMMIDPNDYKDPRIKIVPVLSNEDNPNYEHGFINATIIKKYLPKEYSIFACGPNAMYNFLKGELVKLGIDEHKVRFEHNCVKDLCIINPKEYKLIVHIRGDIYNIKAKENETLLIAMEKANLLVPSRCRSGSCGFCHSRLIKGAYLSPKEYEHRRMADLKFNYIHPCSSYPTSDMEIDVPVFDNLKELNK